MPAAPLCGLTGFHMNIVLGTTSVLHCRNQFSQIFQKLGILFRIVVSVMPPTKRKRMSFVSGLAAYKKQKTAGQAALTAVASLKRRIAAATETKYEDVNTTNAAPVTMTEASAISNLAQVAQGAGLVQRVGQQITAKRLTGRYIVKYNGANSMARVIIVQYKKQSSSSTPSLAKIVENYSAGTGSVWSPYSFTNQFTENFRVLYDKSHAIEASNQAAVRELSIPLNFKIAYNGTLTTDIEKNGIYMFMLSDQTVASGLGPLISYGMRLAYTDD